MPRDKRIRIFYLSYNPPVPSWGWAMSFYRHFVERVDCEVEFEIEPLLKLCGFQIMVMEDLPFKKQVEVCATASALVGPHGGGLTNLLFCPQKSKIGEIAVDGVFPHYSGMAQQSGHLFHRLMVSKAGAQDMVVDVAIFEQWLRLHFNEA